jgi:hypothetical protein
MSAYRSLTGCPWARLGTRLHTEPGSFWATGPLDPRRPSPALAGQKAEARPAKSAETKMWKLRPYLLVTGGRAAELREVLGSKLVSPE